MKERGFKWAWTWAMAWLLAAPATVWAESVAFNLDWVPYGKHSGFYAAVDKGFYKAEGLDVKIVRGYGSADTVQRVATEAAEFGHADIGNLIVIRGNTGAPVKGVAMIHHKSLFCVYVLEKSGIRRPRDLVGRRIGSAPANAVRIMFPALAGAVGIDPKSVTWVDMQAPSELPSLFAEKVDAIVTYATIGPSYFAAAKKANKPVLEFLYSDFGVDLYSNGIITQDGRLQKQPAQVRRFVKASLRGLAFGVEQPDEAMKIFTTHMPTMSAEIARAHLDINNRHLLTEETRKTGIGIMLPEKMRLTLETMAKYNEMKRKPSLEEVYTNQFITEKVVPKMKTL